MKILIAYLIAINLITFIIFGVDKDKAKRHKYRIPEGTLLGFCVMGGALGGWIGMYAFRHKTKKPKFTLTVPLVLIAQITLLVYIIIG